MMESEGLDIHSTSLHLCCCCSAAQACPALCSPMDWSMSGFPVLHHLLELAQTNVYWVGDANQPSHPLSSPTPPALKLSQIRVFSNESALHISWPKYWSISFIISPSNENSGLISFRINWFDLPAVQGIFKSFFQHHSSNHQCFGTQPSLWSKSHIHTWLLEKL